MKFVNRILASVAALLFCAAAHAQTYGISPAVQQIYFSTSGTYPGAGLPLAGGFVFTYAAGTSTPQASYSDASGFTANANPVTLGPNGTPTSGSSPVGIFLSCSLRYKIVLEDANSVVVQTTDNVSCSGNGSSGGGGTNYWTLSGSTITNNNGSGTGNVNVGANLNVGTNLFVTGTVGMADTEATPKYAYIRAPNTMTTTTTWRWPAADAAGCMTSDGAGNLSFSTTCGGGGSGSPGGSNGTVQFNDAASFGGTANLLWNNTAQLLTVTALSSSAAGIVNLSGYIQSENGFLAAQTGVPSTALNYNVIQAPTGGMTALSFTATNYVETGSHAGTPSATLNDSTFPAPGTIYCDTTSTPCTEKLYNGSAWVSLASGGATSPGGSNTQVQFNSSGSFGGSPFFTFSSTGGISVTGVPAITTTGSAVIGGNVTANNLNWSTTALSGNIGTSVSPWQSLTAKLISAADSILWKAESAPALSVANQARVYLDSGSLLLMASINGGAYSPLGGGGGGTPAGSNTQIQFNDSGSFGASANLTFVSSANELIINQGASSLGLLVLGGYAQTEVGLLVQNVAVPSTGLQYNAIQVPTGGVLAKSIRATNYEESGNSNGIPPLTAGEGAFQAGAHYWDTGSMAWKVYDGTSWLTVSTGSGVGTLNSLSGNLNITNGSVANEINVFASGSTIALTLPQQIGTGSDVQFRSLNINGTTVITNGLSGTFNNLAVSGTGGASTFGGNGITLTGAFFPQVNVSADTNGNSIQTAGGINTCSTGSCAAALEVNSSIIINLSGQFVGAGVNTSGTVSANLLNTTTGITSGGGISATGYNINGGFFGQTHTVTIGSCSIFFEGGIAYAFSGC